MTKRAKKSAFETRLIRSMSQAVAIKRGRLAPASTYALPLTARGAAAAPAPVFTPADVREIRRILGLSQALFAQVLNISAATVRSWEQGVRSPDGAAQRMLEIARIQPALLRRFVQPHANGRSRRSES